ncbi:MAG TPA: hypothetical protein VER03_01445, partial [Bryobacteraceae bacterium]|nr:hypothetical protein [Bryobacteraceae bacterium]
EEGNRLRVSTPDTAYICEHVIFAAPLMLARYLLEKAPVVTTEYSPWVTANISLHRMPRERGLDLAWDNVIYDSTSLGYVAATHMTLGSRVDRSVWTWYTALTHGRPAAMRTELLTQTWDHWRDTILADLSRPHPDIRDCVSRIEVMRIGHAMARPTPGSIFSEARARLAMPHGRIHFAHSDVSGFSVFEEAQYRGVEAADRTMRLLSKG